MGDVETIGSASTDVVEKPRKDLALEYGGADRTNVVPDLLSTLFVERRDVKAEQSADGKYFPVYSEMTERNLRDHLSGNRTFGHYLLLRTSAVCSHSMST